MGFTEDGFALEQSCLIIITVDTAMNCRYSSAGSRVPAQEDDADVPAEFLAVTDVLLGMKGIAADLMSLSDRHHPALAALVCPPQHLWSVMA